LAFLGGEARKILKKNLNFFSGFCDFFVGFGLQKNPGLWPGASPPKLKAAFY